MTIEDILLGPRLGKTSYSQTQLLTKLAKMRKGMALNLPEGHQLIMLRGQRMPKERVIAAIDAEFARVEAFEQLLIAVATERIRLKSRRPLWATAIGDLELVLGLQAGDSPPRRAALGLAPRKKPRRLNPEERFLSTMRLRATRAQNGTAAKKPRAR
jgi:hypothetical protein